MMGAVGLPGMVGPTWPDGADGRAHDRGADVLRQRSPGQ
jgi:hypothetical protein